MSISMYRMTVPVFQRGLANLAVYLDKAEAHAREAGENVDALVAARLAPDMLGLAGQYQRATDTAKFAIGRLTGIETPRFEDNEATVAELRERVSKARNFLAAVAPEAFEGSDAREVTIAPGGTKTVLRGDEYVLTFALPNFFFHVATAHAILRHKGVSVGKMDYLGSFA